LNSLGIHLLLELKDCRIDLLDDLPFIQKTLINAAVSTGATIVGQTFHKFSPQGVTGVVAIAESHLSIHTWPEHGYAAADIFTCGASFNPREAAQIIIEKFECRDPSIVEVERGRLQQVAGVPQ